MEKKPIQWYTKIDTCFKRDMNRESATYNCIIPGELTREEFAWAAEAKVQWECTEKIDGECTSIHLIPCFEELPDGTFRTWIDPNGNEHKSVIGYSLEVHGKTSAANMRPDEVELLNSLTTEEKLLEVFTQKKVSKDGICFSVVPESEIIIFGETYGKGMQKGGGRYCKDRLKFIAFDIRVGNTWLLRSAVLDICNQLEIEVVPLVGYMTLAEAIDYVRRGFPSDVAEDDTLEAEGLVLKFPMNLLDRSGRRLITKIKTKDFRDLEKKLNAIPKVRG